ncbi:hypothetical protein BOTCAL_0018g00050 [Botryotinia calthae]|uniref:Uncharacterized protein n=1 Tax=Botryotinia calthae TaxID=38488 RepID=A0A4Y8DFE5_9HELO|nr:hypothetical protein BOTCAL_0018g00050 [Botryotinia calthae]
MEYKTELHTSTADSLKVDLELQKLIEDVLAQLKDRFQSDGGKSSTKHKITDSIEKILKCIQLIGGVAAEAASTVFAPATLCFNAISFLIDIPQKVAEIYEGLGNLFEEMTHAMALLNIYGNYKKLDRELKDGIHKIMVSIVRICGLSINIIDGGKKAKVKTILKVTFLKDDSGIKDELSNFKALITKQNGLTGVITLKSILDNSAELFAEQQIRIADKVTYVEGDLKAKGDEKITSDRVEKISKLLSMPEGSAKANTASEELKDLRKQFPKDAFKWLSTDYGYNEWLGISDYTCPSPFRRLLNVHGGVKTGKSCLVASIEEDLRSRKIANLAIAYHAFTEVDSKSNKTARNNDMVYALKSVALQLATQSKTYAAALSQLKEKDLRITDTRERSVEKQWRDKLRFAKDPGSREPLTIVLLFDGLDKLPKSNDRNFLEFLREQRRSFASESSLQLLILVTARYNHTFGDLDIDITHLTKDDIKSFIEQELNKLGFLEGQDVEMKQLRKLIRERLPKIAEGSFSIILQKLTRITEALKCDAYSDDLEAILDPNSFGDVAMIAQDIIADLNTSLSARDIVQLNEILDWAIFGYKTFSIGQIRASLWLSSGRLPVQPLEWKLKGKFAKVSVA